MDSTNNNDNNIISRSRKSTRFIKDEATISAFRKRTKKLIIILLLFLTTTLSTIGALYFYLLQTDNYKYESAIRAFCHCTIYDSSSCEREYYNVMNSNYEDIKNPNQVFYLAIRTASEKLDAIAVTDDDPELRNCSIALHGARGQINQIRETIFSSRFIADPDRLFQQGDEMWNLTVEAINGLKSCLESQYASNLIGAEVAQVEMHMNYSEDYILRYYEAWRMFGFEAYKDDRDARYAKEFVMGMVGLQCLFMFFLILSLFRTW